MNPIACICLALFMTQLIKSLHEELLNKIDIKSGEMYVIFPVLLPYTVS